MKFIELICLLGSCFRIEDQVGSEESFIDELMTKLPPLVFFKVASYLPFSILHFRLLSHSHNFKVIKLYRSVVEDEFNVSLGNLAVFRSWNMACVKFVDRMIRIIERLETEGHIKKRSKKYYEGAIVRKPSLKKNNCANSVRVFCDDTSERTFASSELSFKELDLLNLLQVFIRLYQERREIEPVALLLDFLNYTKAKVSRCTLLIDFWNELKENREREAAYLAFKVIKVLRYNNFRVSDGNELTGPSWLDLENQMIKKHRIHFLWMVANPDESESVSWNSVFDDREEVCRVTVRSFHSMDDEK